MRESDNLLPWLGLTLLVQTGWGAFPVLARYLQTVSNLPSMSLVALGNLLALVLLSAFILPRVEWRALRFPALWLFAFIVVGRGLTNFLAARFTLSIFVQLITQLTPFIVVLLTTAVFRERLPRYTGRAITLCLLGAVLMIGGEIGVTAVSQTIGRSDWLGITLAFISSILLALYMIFVRRSTRQAIGSETLLFAHLLSLSAAGFILSALIGEDWSQWTATGPRDWIIFGVLVIVASSNFLQIGVIRHLGAPLVSSTLAWRLVSALIVAALLLDERLTSIWQAAGAALVLLTITWYLRQQAVSAGRPVTTTSG